MNNQAVGPRYKTRIKRGLNKRQTRDDNRKLASERREHHTGARGKGTQAHTSNSVRKKRHIGLMIDAGRG